MWCAAKQILRCAQNDRTPKKSRYGFIWFCQGWLRGIARLTDFPIGFYRVWLQSDTPGSFCAGLVIFRQIIQI
jgi:hypothetical protein